MLTAREIAERVLSGLPVPQPDPIPMSPGAVEIKMCEFCPRTFVRKVGSDKKHCGHCDPHAARGRKKARYREQTIRHFDAVAAGTSRAYRQSTRRIGHERNAKSNTAGV